MKNKIITCPICGEEYFPGEILYPNYIVGQPKNIFKNEKGRIEYWEGQEQDLTETYICDKCNTPFTIKTNINFEVEVDDKYNFNKDYSSSIYNNRITLNEE